MKKFKLSYLLVGLSCMTILCGFALQREQQNLADKLIRLHVVANSDTQEDQTIKLQVRDAVLDVTDKLLESEIDPMGQLSKNLGAIQAVANEKLEEVGCNHVAVVTLEQELFPTRDYDTFSLPAGTYTSLRVTIGAGVGQNWWCVVYPSLCLPASVGELEDAAIISGLTQGEIQVITHQDEVCELKFQAWEWIAGICSVFE